MKLKAEAGEKERVRNYLSCIVVKNADGKALKQLDKLCLTCFEFGKKEGREGVIRYDEGYCYNCKKATHDAVIKEIEKKMEVHRVVKWVMDNDKDYEGEVMVIKKKEWEGVKNNKKEKKNG